VLVPVLAFLQGLELAQTVNRVAQQWYQTVEQADSWKLQAVALSEQAEGLFDTLGNRVKSTHKRLIQAESHKQTLDETAAATLTASALDPNHLLSACWKFVYWYVLVKTCSECGQPDGKMRFTQLLRRALCGNCRKLEKYQMIDHHAALKDYGITKKDLNRFKIDGLRISDPLRDGKQLYVYYKTAIEALLKQKNRTIPEAPPKARPVRPTKPPSISLEERAAQRKSQRRESVLATLKKLSISETPFARDLLESVDSWAALYIAGEIRVSPSKLTMRLENLYRKWENDRLGGPASKRSKGYEGDITSQRVQRPKHPEPINLITDEPVKKRKLTESDFVQRRDELIARLAQMGVPADSVEFEDPDEEAYKYVHGLMMDIGPVAGAIWRKNRPTFSGVGVTMGAKDCRMGK
jgi:hypothetical protein